MPVLAVVLVLLAVSAAPARAAVPDWRPDVADAARHAATRSGQVSFAVRTERAVWGHRMHTDVPAASVVKAMLLVAYLNHPAVRDRALTARDHALLRPMVRESDDVTATAVRDRVGNRRLTALARRARMFRFRVHPWWGKSRINAADQTRFFLRIDRLTVARHRAYALGELSSVVPSQRWGVGRVGLGGWQLAFKGGWGSGTGAVDHQVALLRRGDERVAVAVTTTGNRSHADGKRTLEGVFRRLLRGLPSAARAGRTR